ncbi:MAG: MotA/TolQ/ExbB proton channel family protein [Gammaproteobacteria bacterium]|nr:MotA/TolQ/ExbB proton channel family protein [Gammaproteobacteria bacterium]
MFELVKSGGWLMVPILACSVIAMALVAERLWTLRRKYVIPPNLLQQVRQVLQHREISTDKVRLVSESSPLGRILAVGLANRDQGREVLKESIEETGRHVVHELGRYLNMLGTIAAITPLLGLLGTVIGMIKVFAAITSVGVGDPTVLAGGISEALITTAAGLTVGIPSLMFHRFFRARVTELTVNMEQASLHLVEFIQGQRETGPAIQEEFGNI